MKKNIKLGIIGGGQLGRMLIQAAGEDIETFVLDPTPNSPAGQVADHQIVGDFKNAQMVKKLVKKVDYLTYEIESANWQVLKNVSKSKKVNPNPKTLEIIQDKLKQKEFLKKLKIKTPLFTKIENTEDLLKFIEKVKLPVILKARFFAYDGRGNAQIHKISDTNKALAKLAGQKLYAEKFIPFSKEIATQIIKGSKGKIFSYPVVETIQKNNICHIVKAPADISKKSSQLATTMATSIVKKLHGYGVFGVEMFLTTKGEVLANEIAPRVHNSGHYTIEACNVSQFEQHIKAVVGQEVKKPKMVHKSAVMINILGERNGPIKLKGLDKIRQQDGAYAHIYGKFETRKERKMGHITVVGNNLDKLFQKATSLRKAISI